MVNIHNDTVVFLHAHPDDEAIFTGGTIATLRRRGHRVVVVVATGGELGLPVSSGPNRRPTLAAHRRREAEVACATLGVDRLVFLHHIDSGLEPRRRDRPWGAFVDVQTDVVAEQVADIVEHEGAGSIVTYDDAGVYGHPDHVKAHEVGHRAADLAGVPTRYDATVDREYLHFVDSHLVSRAAGSPPSSRAWGLATVEISTTVDVRAHLGPKREAIAAHASQLGDGSWLGDNESFAAAYGYEWFVRHGPRGSIDALADRRERVGVGS